MTEIGRCGQRGRYYSGCYWHATIDLCFFIAANRQSMPGYISYVLEVLSQSAISATAAAVILCIVFHLGSTGRIIKCTVVLCYVALDRVLWAVITAIGWFFLPRIFVIDSACSNFAGNQYCSWKMPRDSYGYWHKYRNW